MAPIVAGLATGIAGAMVAGDALSRLLYDVSPRDPAIVAGVTVLLGLVGLAACSVPARRATHTNPLEALRYS